MALSQSSAMTTMGTPKSSMGKTNFDLTKSGHSMTGNSVFSNIHNPFFSDVNPFSIHALNRLSFPAQLLFSSPHHSNNPSATDMRIKPSEVPFSTANINSWDLLSFMKDKNPESSGLEICNDSSCSETGDCNSASYRNHKRPIPSEQKDGKYFERRRRNNMAAKKSRDARKNREDQLAMRVSDLEKENAVLRAHVAFFQDELNMLQLCFLQKANPNFNPTKHLANGSSAPRTIVNS